MRRARLEWKRNKQYFSLASTVKTNLGRIDPCSRSYKSFFSSLMKNIFLFFAIKLGHFIIYYFFNVTNAQY